MDTDLILLLKDYEKIAGAVTAWLDIKESVKAPDFTFPLETDVPAMDNPKEQAK